MLTNGTIITNSAVISVIGTLAIVASTFVLEAVFWFLQKLLATKRPSDAFKISIGAETSFAFQLGTSLWVSYRRLTRGTRNSPSLSTTLTKFNGINTITCVSV